MASNLRVDSIVPATGSSVSIGTATGGVNIPGVLTYEDVTNVDSVGVITARSGIRIGATGANTLIQGAATGISLGTGTPRQKLHIHASDSGASNMVFTNATTGNSAGDGFVVGITGGEVAQLNMQENADLKFSTADTERLRIHSDGKIAIGSAETSTGLLLLDKTLTAESDASDKNNYHLVVRSQTNSNTSKIGIAFANTTDDTHVGASILHHRESTDSIGSLAFYTSPSSGTTTERMKIDRNGQVTKPASCAFNVTPNGNQSLGNGETLTSWKTTDSRGFENTTTGGYFGSGIFTAPVTGAYYFTSNILLYDTNGTNSIHLYWQKNGSGAHTYWNTRFNAGDFGYGNYMPVAGACTMYMSCLLYTSPSPRDATLSRMPSSA